MFLFENDTSSHFSTKFKLIILLNKITYNHVALERIFVIVYLRFELLFFCSFIILCEKIKTFTYYYI